MKLTMKLIREIDTNLTNNSEFRSFCEEQGVLHHGFYGQEELRFGTEVETVQAFKAIHKVWYKDSFEADMALEAMPVGGWQSEKDEVAFLRQFRKIDSCRNSEVRAFMREWTGDSDWEL